MIGKTAIAIIGLTFAQWASADPVSIFMPELYQFNHSFGLRTDFTNMDFGNSTCLACPNEWAYGQTLSGGSGSASIWAYARVDTMTASSDTSFSWMGSQTLAAFASVDPSLSDGWAYAEASVMRFDLLTDIFEPVMFSGTHALFDALSGFEYASGSMLQPGSYVFSVLPFATRVVAEAGPERTDFAQAMQHVRYDFVSVPLPPTAALLAIGLLGLALRKRERV